MCAHIIKFIYLYPSYEFKTIWILYFILEILNISIFIHIDSKLSVTNNNYFLLNTIDFLFNKNYYQYIRTTQTKTNITYK